jgi:nucleolar protein 56
MTAHVCNRALKTRGNTPKYGLIFHSSFIGRAKQRNKGRISRYLANKCSIASRIDCFMDTATNVFGEKMREQVGSCPAGLGLGR